MVSRIVNGDGLALATFLRWWDRETPGPTPES